MKDTEITIYDFATKQYYKEPLSVYMEDETILGGHGGGDAGITKAFCDLIADGKTSVSVGSGMISAENHVAVFAAEKSRRTGTVVSMEEYKEELYN